MGRAAARALCGLGVHIGPRSPGVSGLGGSRIGVHTGAASESIWGLRVVDVDWESTPPSAPDGPATSNGRAPPYGPRDHPARCGATPDRTTVGPPIRRPLDSAVYSPDPRTRHAEDTGPARARETEDTDDTAQDPPRVAGG